MEIDKKEKDSELILDINNRLIKDKDLIIHKLTIETTSKRQIFGKKNETNFKAKILWTEEKSTAEIQKATKK